jgi:hypothetical protein
MIVAMYDITGIQEFVFSSTRLRENLGASIIVQRIFADFFAGQSGARIVYIGGGNAMVAYDDRDRYREATCGLSREFVRRPAVRSLRGACRGTGGHLLRCAKKAHVRAEQRKNRRTGECRYGHRHHAECPHDGWPVVTEEDGEGCPTGVEQAREDPDAYFRETRTLLDEALAASGRKIPQSYRQDRYGGAEIHRSGAHRRQQRRPGHQRCAQYISGYEEAAGAMKRLFPVIDEAYNEAFSPRSGTRRGEPGGRSPSCPSS